MVKQNPSTNFNRHNNQYPPRVSHAKPMNWTQSRNNRVEVTQSKGCCGSRKVASVPSQPIIVQSARKPSPPPPAQPTAHQRTHMKLDPPDPFYARYRRIRKNPNRTPRNYQSEYGTHPMNSTRSTGEPQHTNRSRNYQAPSARQQQPPPPPPPTLRAPQTTTPKKSRCCTIL